MANIKSAKKRIKIIAKKTLRNKMIKSRTHTFIVKVNKAVASNDVDLAKENLKTAIKYIDIAVSKGVYHKNNGARKKSRLASKVNKMIA